MYRHIIPAAFTLFLAGCGGQSESGQPASSSQSRLLASVGTSVEQVPYEQSVAQLYIAYFARPADPHGEGNFAAQLKTLGIASNLQEIEAAAASNVSAAALINSFGTSAESAALYGSGNDIVFVTAIYQNVLDRTPDLNGLVFWTDALAQGKVTRARVALAIMAAAQANTSTQGLRDGKLVLNRTLFATQATAEMRKLDLVNIYVGSNSAAIGRAWLAGITADDTAASIALKVADFIRQLRGEAPRCSIAPCAPGAAPQQ